MKIPDQKEYWNKVAEEKEFPTPFQMEEFRKYVSKEMKILDVGCGYGRTLNELYNQGFKNLTGIDYSQGMINRGLRLYPHLNLIKNDGNTIPFPDNEFDAVILLAVLTFTKIIQPEMIIVISFLLGVGNAFDATPRHAFVNELVEKEDLTNAIALNSTMFNTATALSPAIAGIIYAFLGPAWCFTINGISFIAVIFNLFKMDIKKRNIINEKKSVLNELKEGIIYLTKNKLLLKIISITSILSFFGMGLVTLFPAWAVKILNGNSTTNGFLQSARGFGAVSFAIIIASINKYIIRGKYLAASTIILPTLIFLFSFTNNLYESLFMLVLIGGVIILMYNLSNGLIQTNVEENYRGRILSFYTFSFFALYPLGALWIGMLAEHFGIRTSIIINSAILFLFGIIIWFKSDKLKYTS